MGQVGSFRRCALSVRSDLTALAGPKPWFVALAIVGALNAGIAGVYYLRIIAVMFLHEPLSTPQPSGGRSALAVVLVSAVLTVGIGLQSRPILTYLRDVKVPMNVQQARERPAPLIPLASAPKIAAGRVVNRSRTMSVKFLEVRSVRIICDGRLKDRLLQQVLQLSFTTGYTWWEAHGKGQHEMLDNLFSGLDRVYIEVWCNLETAEKIAAHCQSDQFRGLGMTVGMESFLVPESESAKFTKRA